MTNEAARTAIPQAAANSNRWLPPADEARMPLPIPPNDLDLIGEFDNALRGKLQIYNNSLDAGGVGFETMAREFASLLRPDRIAQFLDVSAHSPEPASRLLQRVGFLVSSLERHSQGAGGMPGAALNQFPGLASRLAQLGAAAGRPPRDDHYSYWVWNASSPITFTGSKAELAFNHAVNQTEWLATAAADMSIDLRIGALEFSNPDASDALVSAAANADQLRHVFAMLNKPQEGEQEAIINPRSFSQFRNYLLSYPIEGVMYPGPNAAYVAGFSRLDISIGAYEPGLPEIVHMRLKHMNKHDSVLVRRELTLPTLADLAARKLGLTATAAATLSAQELAARLSALDKNALETFRAFNRLVVAFKAASAVHWGSIRRNLVLADKKLSADEIARLPVKPNVGVSGTHLDATRKLNDARQEHWTATTLSKAIRMLDQ